MKQNICLLICDGIGDRPLDELDGQTPLQAARTPNMDWFAKHGASGIMDPIGPGIRVGSDTGHLAILGYDARAVYTGRGPFEAVGVGMDVEPGDVAFRCNFGTVDGDMVVKDRRAGRIRGGTAELAQSLNEVSLPGVKLRFQEAVEHRGVLVLRGEGLGADVTDTDPHAEAKVWAARGRDPASERTAALVNEFVARSHEVLREHPVNRGRAAEGKLPANVILTRGAGVVPRLPGLEERFGIDAACVVGISLIKGICRLAGMDVLDAPGATGGTDTDLGAKAGATLDALERYDLVLLNVKLPDIYGHDGNALGKVEGIERIDAMLGDMKKDLKGYCIAITGDHSTPVPVMDHSGDPVPLTLCGEGVRRDRVTRFDEVSAAHGGLCRVRGRDLLPMLMNITTRSEKFGA